jgi:hypothetical protein
MVSAAIADILWDDQCGGEHCNFLFISLPDRLRPRQETPSGALIVSDFVMIGRITASAGSVR